jgi:hypothetical protein
LDTNGKITSQLCDERNFNFSIVNFPCLCSNIPASPAYGVYTRYLAADLVCKSLFDIRSVFSSRQSTEKQLDVTGVSTVSFAGSFPQILWSLQRSCLTIYSLSLGHMLSDVFHTNR